MPEHVADLVAHACAVLCEQLALRWLLVAPEHQQAVGHHCCTMLAFVLCMAWFAACPGWQHVTMRLSTAASAQLCAGAHLEQLPL